MLDAKRFGLAAGILWALYMCAYTILSIYTGQGTVLLSIMENIYPGYTISWAGILPGMFFGFIDGFIGLFLFALIYNKLSKYVR